MNVLLQVLRKPLTIALTIGVAILTLAFAVLAPNLGLIKQVAADAGFLSGLQLSLNLLLSIHTNLTVQSIVVTTVIGFFLGLNLSLLVYKITQAREFGTGAAATGGLGFFLGLLGVGCAACGTALITTILPFVGIGGALALLPFGGIELQFIALALLALSIWLLVRNISKPAVCQISLAKE